MRLEAVDITAGYGARLVLENISLSVQSGEFVGLIGPNGCGKSTLLRALSGVLRLRSGAVRLDNRELASLSPLEIARRVAFVPQTETPTFDFTVRELVSMGRYPHTRGRRRTSDDSERIDCALQSADLAHLANRSALHISGGEQRRVLLARALAQDTALLLLDEPTAHLDIAHQYALLRLVRGLTQRSHAPIGALAALHDLNQAAEFCDRLVLLSAGRMLSEGRPEYVLTVEHLRAIYGAEVEMGVNPATGRPMILTLHPPHETSYKGSQSSADEVSH